MIEIASAKDQITPGASKVPEPIKARLRAVGLWQEYRDRYEEYQRELPPKKARYKTLMELIPDMENKELIMGEKPESRTPKAVNRVEFDVDDLDFGNDNDYRRNMDWVFNHVGIEPDEFTSDPPSRGAANYLLQINTNPKVKETFYNTVMPKLAPSKTETERLQGRLDDGRKLHIIIEGLLEPGGIG